MEVTAFLLLRAAEDATRELNLLTHSIVTGQMTGDILTDFHEGSLIAISGKNSVPVLSYALSLLEPKLLNCSQINENFLCTQLGTDFVWMAKSKLGLPAITHTSEFYPKLKDALNSKVINDFPKCLEKALGNGIKWRYFCWGKKGRKGFRVVPEVLPVSLHSADPENVELDLGELHIQASPDLSEASSLLKFESKAYSYMEDLSAPLSLGGYSLDWMFFALTVLVVI